ncbi:MAG: molybdopterin-dependent oxidoreductase [Granulosicoccus sp.]
MTNTYLLPPGQKAINHFPRFGLSQYAARFPTETDSISIQVSGCVQQDMTLAENLNGLDRVEQLSDFHCVTTWSKTGLRWGGYRFSEVYEKLIKPAAEPSMQTQFMSFHAQDGYRILMPLEYLMAPDVMLADTLDGEPLGIEHGAPVRLIAPSHYGYKNPKHVKRINCLTTDRNFKPVSFRFMAHPTARVAYEERAIGAPGWLFRYLYRPLVAPTIKRFDKETRRMKHEALQE